MSALSGWCSAPPSIRPKHEGCRWDLCGCSCHLTSANVSYDSGIQGQNVRESEGNETAPRRCANTVVPGGLADYQGVD